MTAESGIVFNIQRFTVHDGPGIRTEVFLKGCPLQCKWCSNPESISPRQELGIYPSKCLGRDKCGFCVKACPKHGAPLEFNEDGIIVGSNEKCLRCMACAGACFTHSIKAWGEVMTVDQVINAVMADEIYYKKSGGGVTLSGGEVTVQWKFALALLEACHRQRLHTCVETCMQCDPKVLERFYPLSDLVICDIKHMDSETHRRFTGVPNELILNNIKQTAQADVPMIIRVPVIPEVNNSEENIRKTAQFIKEKLENKVLQVQLLPYKKMGTEKYASLGVPYPMGEEYTMLPRPVWEENLLHLAELMKEEYGIRAVAGSNSRIEDESLSHARG